MNPPLQRAEAAYRALDFEKVLPLLDDARVMPTTASEYRRIVELTAFVHAIYGRTSEARDAFVELLRLDATYTLPADASPKMRDALQKAVALRAAAAPVVVAPVVQEPLAVVAPPPVEVVTAVPQPIWKTWWLWSAVAVVGAAAVTGVVIAHDQYPHRDFGPYQVR